MAAFTNTVTPTNSSTANFRAWGSAIGTRLAAFGLVKTADTGQIDWTTVLAPVGTHSVMGYEIWRFADALQASVPVFFKIEFGSGVSINNPSVHFTMSSGSDGAGTLTGVKTVRRQYQCTATATPVTAYWSGDTNRFIFIFQGALVANSLMLSVERTLDSSGVVTNEGVLHTAWSSSLFSQVAYNNVTGPYTLFEIVLGAIGPSVAPFGTTGVQTAVYPVFHTKGVFLNYGMNLMGYIDATISANAIIAITVYSASRNFMPVGADCINSSLARTAPASVSTIMMRYE